MRIESHWKWTHKRSGKTEPARFNLYYDDGRQVSVATLHSMEDAALVARFLSGGNMPDEQCTQVQAILRQLDKEHDQ